VPDEAAFAVPLGLVHGGVGATQGGVLILVRPGRGSTDTGADTEVVTLTPAAAATTTRVPTRTTTDFSDPHEAPAGRTIRRGLAISPWARRLLIDSPTLTGLQQLERRNAFPDLPAWSDWLNSAYEPVTADHAVKGEIGFCG
jgi:hypothetical protein